MSSSLRCSEAPAFSASARRCNKTSTQSSKCKSEGQSSRRRLYPLCSATRQAISRANDMEDWLPGDAGFRTCDSSDMMCMRGVSGVFDDSIFSNAKNWLLASMHTSNFAGLASTQLFACQRAEN